MEDCLKNPACDVNTAVAGKFHGVLAGVAVGGTEYGGDAIVQRGAVRVEEAAVGAGVARHGRQRFSGDAAEARLRKGNGVAAGDADDGDSAGGVGCGNGCNGICGRHKTVSFPVSLNSPSSLSHFPRKSKIPPLKPTEISFHDSLP